MPNNASLSQTFVRFAEIECGLSPLYHTLALGIAGEPDLLALADLGHPPKPNMLLAAVHFLLLGGVKHPLLEYYPSLTPTPLEPIDAFPLFRDFCRQHTDAIKAILGSLRVQTNEVSRAAVLRPGFAVIAEATGGRPLALVEVGTSAGLLLFWDRYTCDYLDGDMISGDAGFTIRCSVKGDRMPSLRLPAVVARVGIDLHPIDVQHPAEARWLRALVWADQTGRDERLEWATELVQRERPTLLRGDATAVVPGVLASLPTQAVACIFHCHTLNQFPPDERERFRTMLARESNQREIYVLGLEYFTATEYPEMRLTRYAGGTEVEHRLLARYQAHGEWLEWLA